VEGKMFEYDDDDPIYVVEFSDRAANWPQWVQKFVE